MQQAFQAGDTSSNLVGGTGVSERSSEPHRTAVDTSGQLESPTFPPRPRAGRKHFAPRPASPEHLEQLGRIDALRRRNLRLRARLARGEADALGLLLLVIALAVVLDVCTTDIVRSFRGPIAAGTCSCADGGAP